MAQTTLKHFPLKTKTFYVFSPIVFTNTTDNNDYENGYF